MKDKETLWLDVVIGAVIITLIGMIVAISIACV